MRLLPQRIFSRLVFGLVIVSTVAIGTGAYYLYSRFHDVHSPFHEGTLQLFAKEILKGISVRDGKVVATIGNDLDAALPQRASETRSLVAQQSDGP